MWLQGLFDCGRDGVLELSDAGHIIKLNKAALIMFAYEQHQLVGRHISHLLRSPGASDKIMRQLASGIRSVSRESSSSSADPSLTVTFPPEESEALRRNETDPFFVSVSMTVIADKARKRGALVLLTMRDITVDRQKSELLSTEKQRSEQLLCNILPKTVAVRMSKGETTIVDACDMVSVLFLDLVGFTSLSATMVPHDLVVTLNEIISGFDDIITRNGCEKIKTIGDAIMVTAGVPDPRPDHARILLQTAMEFGQYLKEVNARRNLSFDFRCGINSGPVVAGVIGKIRTAWDVWGPTVNVASRMESTSLPGRIQVSRSTYEQVYKFYEFEERTVFCKGVGDMTCYLLVGPSRPSDRSG
jgi:class 3 adenylate cyclase